MPFKRIFFLQALPLSCQERLSFGQFEDFILTLHGIPEGLHALFKFVNHMVHGRPRGLLRGEVVSEIGILGGKTVTLFADRGVSLFQLVRNWTPARRPTSDCG